MDCALWYARTGTHYDNKGYAFVKAYQSIIEPVATSMQASQGALFAVQAYSGSLRVLRHVEAIRSQLHAFQTHLAYNLDQSQVYTSPDHAPAASKVLQSEHCSKSLLQVISTSKLHALCVIAKFASCFSYHRAQPLL